MGAMPPVAEEEQRGGKEEAFEAGVAWPGVGVGSMREGSSWRRSS